MAAAKAVAAEMTGRTGMLMKELGVGTAALASNLDFASILFRVDGMSALVVGEGFIKAAVITGASSEAPAVVAIPVLSRFEVNIG